jgi:circadian clock protein KaiC
LLTGIEGFDNVLGDGLPANHLYLIEGDPGAGKTTLALQYLLEGTRRGEKVMYFTLSETREEVEEVAHSHGWSLDQMTIVEMADCEENLAASEQNTLFHPSELELGDTTQRMLAEVSRVGPSRVVIDSLADLRLLAQDSLRYRRQVRVLKQFFNRHRCTVLLLDDRTSGEHDSQLHSLVHGLIRLERLSPEYGVMRRRLHILKLRARAFRAGYHDFII